jgi:hypothetical protein
MNQIQRTSRRHTVWRTLLGASLLLSLALLLALVFGPGLDWTPITRDLHLVVNGQEWTDGQALATLTTGHGLVAAVVGLAVGLVALVLGLFLVPLAVAGGLLLLALLLLATVGVPLLAVAAVLAVVLSPLWLLIALLAWAVWPARRPATIAT